MKSSQGDSAELALAAVLDALASILIPLEITPSRLAQIARASFVKAGAVEARMRSSGRPHLARIAALTGLSRSEVKRIVSANFGFGSLEPENAPRALRVLNAWRESKAYSQGGKPKALRINGRFPSFESLCKQHSGDIPHKVILTVLERRKSVALTKGRTWVSVLRTPARRIERTGDLGMLAFAASFLADLSEGDRVLIKRKERISAPPDIPRTYLEDAIAGRVGNFLDHLPELFTSNGRLKKRRDGVNVYALVSRVKKSR